MHEYADEELKHIDELNIDVIAVSDDYNSSLKTLNIAKRYSWIIPAVGIHPWVVDAMSIKDVEKITRLVLERKNEIRVLGEVGLDRKFKPETYSYQLHVFKVFIDLSVELKAILNIHAAGAWKEVIDLLTKSDVPSAIVHWYTGPPELLREFVGRDFYISINPAISIQRKHREIVATAPLDIILVESDGPYNYKGLVMHPRNIFDVIKHIADIRNMDPAEIFEVIATNYERLKSRHLS